jgi:MoxR-like ATPase
MQNPIEQEGTYILPEAQLDRFMFKIKVEYPNRDEERVIFERMAQQKPPQTKATFSTQKIMEIRAHLDQVYLDERIKEYILCLVTATRKNTKLLPTEANEQTLREIQSHIHVGASPRATIFLSHASKANALLENRTFVIPEDIKAVAFEILRHRLILTFEAEARNLSGDDLISLLLETVTVP